MVCKFYNYVGDSAFETNDYEKAKTMYLKTLFLFWQNNLLDLTPIESGDDQFKIKDFPESRQKHATELIKLLVKTLIQLGKVHFATNGFKEGIKAYKLASWYADNSLLETSITRTKIMQFYEKTLKQNEVKLAFLRNQSIFNKLNEMEKIRIK